MGGQTDVRHNNQRALRRMERGTTPVCAHKDRRVWSPGDAKSFVAGLAQCPSVIAPYVAVRKLAQNTTRNGLLHPLSTLDGQ